VFAHRRGRRVRIASDDALQIGEFDNDVARVDRTFEDFRVTTASEEPGAIFRESRRRQLAVARIGLLVQHVHMGDPVGTH
jgi:hypothetical protein